MADLTYKQAQTANELVPGTAGANQEQITGAEVVGATSATDVDSGWTFSNLKSWVKLDADWMSKSVYDSNSNGRVDDAEQLNDGTNVVTAADARAHLDNSSIHFVINDSSTAASVAWSGSKINSELASKLTNLQNIGTGDASLYAGKSGVVGDIKRLAQSGSVTLSETASAVTISSDGEANTGSNLGTGEGQVFAGKTGVDLRHRTLKQGSNITITQDATEITISATISTNLTDAEFPTYAVFDELVSGGAAIDFASGNKQSVDASVNNAVTVTAPAGKPANFMLRILNSGSLTSIAPAAGGTILWAGGTAPSWAGRSDLALFYDGTNWVGSALVNVS